MLRFQTLIVVISGLTVLGQASQVQAMPDIVNSHPVFRDVPQPSFTEYRMRSPEQSNIVCKRTSAGTNTVGIECDFDDPAKYDKEPFSNWPLIKTTGTYALGGLLALEEDAYAGKMFADRIESITEIEGDLFPLQVGRRLSFDTKTTSSHAFEPVTTRYEFEVVDRIAGPDFQPATQGDVYVISRKSVINTYQGSVRFYFFEAYGLAILLPPDRELVAISGRPQARSADIADREARFKDRFTRFWPTLALKEEPVALWRERHDFHRKWRDDAHARIGQGADIAAFKDIADFSAALASGESVFKLPAMTLELYSFYHNVFGADPWAVTEILGDTFVLIGLKDIGYADIEKFNKAIKFAWGTVAAKDAIRLSGYSFAADANLNPAGKVARAPIDKGPSAAQTAGLAFGGLIIDKTIIKQVVKTREYYMFEFLWHDLLSIAAIESAQRWQRYQDGTASLADLVTLMELETQYFRMNIIELDLRHGFWESKRGITNWMVDTGAWLLGKGSISTDEEIRKVTELREIAERQHSWRLDVREKIFLAP